MPKISHFGLGRRDKKGIRSRGLSFFGDEKKSREREKKEKKKKRRKEGRKKEKRRSKV